MNTHIYVRADTHRKKISLWRDGTTNNQATFFVFVRPVVSNSFDESTNGEQKIAREDNLPLKSTETNCLIDITTFLFSSYSRRFRKVDDHFHFLCFWYFLMHRGQWKESKESGSRFYFFFLYLLPPSPSFPPWYSQRDASWRRHRVLVRFNIIT